MLLAEVGLKGFRKDTRTGLIKSILIVVLSLLKFLSRRLDDEYLERQG